MADVTVTAHVFPSANDVRGSEAAGWGESIYEKNLAANWKANLFSQNCVINGFAIPASDPDLTMTIPTGKAYIGGYFVNVDAQAITFPASNTSHIFLKLLRDGNQQVSSVAFEHNTTGTPPADSTKIGTAVTDTDNVTSTTDMRTFAFIDQARLIKPSVGTPELKTATGSAAGAAQLDVVMNDYSFSPAITNATGNPIVAAYAIADPGTTVGRFTVDPGGAVGTTSTIRWRYITASDDPTVWISYDPTTGDIKATWSSDDQTLNDEPGVRVPGMTSEKFRTNGLNGLLIAQEHLQAADARIAAKGLNQQHRLYRALQMLANDDAPSGWLLANCKIQLPAKRLVMK